jgi:hypothetical protein
MISKLWGQNAQLVFKRPWRNDLSVGSKKNNEKLKLDSKMNQKTTNITEYMHHRDKSEEKTYSQRQCYNGCFLYIRLPTMVHVSTVGVLKRWS